jgi:hypothetical protein
MVAIFFLVLLVSHLIAHMMLAAQTNCVYITQSNRQKNRHGTFSPPVVIGMHLSEMKRRQFSQSRSSRADEVLSTLKPVFSREQPEFPTTGYSEVC